MALRLEKAGLGSAESWLRNQMSYDLWQAKKHADKLKVTPFRTPEPA
jgi:plasmid maintenance system antidote protein VapI